MMIILFVFVFLFLFYFLTELKLGDLRDQKKKIVSIFKYQLRLVRFYGWSLQNKIGNISETGIGYW